MKAVQWVGQGLQWKGFVEKVDFESGVAKE